MGSRQFTVLLVEDDARDAGLLARAFTSLGLPGMLQTVAGVDAAIAYLAGEGAYQDRAAFPLPGLILLNLTMSRRANFKLLRWLRGQGALRRIPVVVLAAARQPIGYDQAFELGAASYLVKPIDPEALQSMIKAVVGYWSLDQRHQDKPRKRS
ncbi:MAG TPA: response regulator [Planctomycetota bacterium]|jgi:CheY-like chemotaxis protein|nr:response regulator [Planctomycetota bacterium]